MIETLPEMKDGGRKAADPLPAGSAAFLPPERPFFPEPHPILWPHTVAEAEQLYAEHLAADDEAKDREYAKWWNARTKRLSLAEEDTGEPFAHGFEPAHWAEADEQFRFCEMGLYNAGGKRATKTEWAGRRFVQAACTFGRAKMWAMQGNEETSIATQQQVVWKYLPNKIKALNGKARHGWAKVNYSRDGGFTEGKLVLPNQTEIYFLTFKQDPAHYQGWEVGTYMTPELRAQIAANPWLHNIGVWFDEDAPLKWLTTAEMRCATRGSKILWTFSTLDGITPAVKEVLGTPRTLKSRRAELLPAHQKYVADCPPGEMPYIQTCGRAGWRAMYFHSDLNQFGDNYANVKRRCEGKPFAFVAENAYGWSEDTKHRAFVMFSSVNIIEPEQLPADGTNYMLTDPAGARNWASIWVRVAPGKPTRYYVYRDWPDARRYGPWAEPSDDNDTPNGEMGRAQRSLGYGYTEYKQMWLKEERIGGIPAAAFAEQQDGGGRKAADPQHARLIQEAIEAGSAEELREAIRERYIDPRAGKDQRLADKGATCPIDELAKSHTVDKTGEILKPMIFRPAEGLSITAGISAIVSLLNWDRLEPLCPPLNEPHLYVTSNCQQVIWALSNYVEGGGEACEDFVDLLRYMATSRLRYVPPGAVKTGGGGAY